jgi:hypothetical protein
VALETAQDGVCVTVRSAGPESDEVEFDSRDTADRSLVALSQARFLDPSGRHVAVWVMRSGSSQYIACDAVTGRCSSNYDHPLGDSATYARRCRFRRVLPLKLASAFA